MARQYPNALTREEARRAIYIDFEGGKDKPPSLVGVLIENEYRAIILNSAFRPLARSKKLAFRFLKEFVADTLSLAVTEDRVIAAWTEHEWDKMSEFDNGTLGQIYRNANLLVMEYFKSNRSKTIKKLKRQIKKDVEAGKRDMYNKNVGLKDLLTVDYVGYAYPPDLKSFPPGKAISRRDDQLEKKEENYSKVSTGAKRAFTNLIRYNEHDCMGMAHLIEFVFSRNANAYANI